MASKGGGSRKRDDGAREMCGIEDVDEFLEDVGDEEGVEELDEEGERF